MYNYIKNSAKRIAKTLVFKDLVPAFWCKNDNWGDALSPHLINLISGKKARYDENPYCWKHLVIGSILDRADKYSIVWGSGMIAPEALPKNKPFAIHAVRGPITRARLISAGIACPEVYGDPALLLPLYYSPNRNLKWKVGIIPHYSDSTHPWIESARNQDGVRIIDICSGIYDFVNEVISCDFILSSSLHGLICADAYQIPNRRIKLNSEIIGYDFKFNDYYASMNIKSEAAIQPMPDQKATSIADSIKCFKSGVDLQQLLSVCPFSPS
jgi:pyruvyltransferase